MKQKQFSYRSQDYSIKQENKLVSSISIKTDIDQSVQCTNQINSLEKLCVWEDIDQYYEQQDETTTINSSSSQLNNSEKEKENFQFSEKFNLDYELKTAALNDLPDNAIFYEGFIYRKQSGLFSSWKKRYMVLTNAKLYFFQNKQKIFLLSCINLKHLQTNIQILQDCFILNFLDEAQSIQLNAINKIQFEKWTKKISEVIQLRSQEIKISLKKFNKNLYEQKDFILQSQFIQKAQTGDILLISTQNSGAYLQKFITHSQFNHVALIVKYQNQIKIFQANQDEGVNIYDWNQYINLFKQHKRFAWRKLFYSKKSQIDQFVKATVKKQRGKSYSLNSMKLFRRVSGENLQIQQSRGYFCSQLVAKCYKKLGLLDPQISSVRYWPINFTSRGDMILRNQAFLSTQKNILLRKHLKL